MYFERRTPRPSAGTAGVLVCALLLASASARADVEAAGVPTWRPGLERAIAAREYEASPSRLGLQAPNRAHGLRSYFGPTGVRVVDRTAPGAPELLALTLSGVGRPDALAPVAPGAVSHSEARVEIARAGLVEWYVNSPAGLEQGFTVAAPPRGAGPLTLELAVAGAAVARDGAGLAFRSQAGRRLRFAKLLAFDAAGEPLPARFELAAAGFRVVVDDRAARYPVVIDPLLSGSFDAHFESDLAVSRLGVSVAGAGDVNGDGFADVIVGAELYDAGSTDEGAAFVFHGGPGGPADGTPASADAFLQRNVGGAHFGVSVAGAGDVNGDGYGDVIVGANLYGGGQFQEGAAFVFLGGPGGIADGAPTGPSPANAVIESQKAFSNLGISVAGAGDVNGDGYGDVIVGANFHETAADPQNDEGVAYVFHGSAAGIGDGNPVTIDDPTTADAELESDDAGALFGVSVAGAGDVDGDGYGDVIVGAHAYDAGPSAGGAAFVFLGSASGVVGTDPASAHAQLETFQAGSLTGWSVAGAGDVNGDGYSDVIVGMRRYSDGESEEGGALVFLGGSSGVGDGDLGNAHAVLEAGQVEAEMGHAVAAGDVNGDGYSDVIVGAHLYQDGQLDEGAAFVFLGGAAGIADATAAGADFVLQADLGDARFGFSVASAGDVDGDGLDDVLVGAPRFADPESEEGHAFLYLGSGLARLAGGPGLASGQLQPDQADALLSSVASAGDVNGDGYDDVIVGARRYDDGLSDEGAAFVFLGGPAGVGDGVPGSASAKLSGGEIDAHLGASVAGAGDVNGDGYADVIVGAPGFDTGRGDEGAAFVFLGGAAGVVGTGPGTAHAQLAVHQGTVSLASELKVASAGDVDGDGFSDVIVGAPDYDGGLADEGGAFVFLGGSFGVASASSATAHAAIESNLAGARLGASVASAGDVDGDGHGDVIVGAPLYANGSPAEGAAFVFLGSPAGVVGTTPGTAHAQLESDVMDAKLGGSVASAGDVDGEGHGDVVVGADCGCSGYERVFVFLGSAGGIVGTTPASAHAELSAVQADARFGGSVASAGDVNGDGYADLLLGARTWDDGQSDEGAAFVVLGGAAGIPSGAVDGPLGVAAGRLEADQAGAGLGAAVASAGDVNGDGFADVIVGAPGYDDPESGEGAAFVFLGGAGGRPTLPRQLRGDASGTPVEPWGLSHHADAFQASLFVTSPRGRERARVELEVCPAGLPFGDPGCSGQTSSAWVDLGTAGASFSETVSGLVADDLYRWRARALYAPFRVTEPGITAPPSPRAGPWRRPGGQSVEADVRLPEPGAAALAAGAALLAGLALRRRTRSRSSGG